MIHLWQLYRSGINKALRGEVILLESFDFKTGALEGLCRTELH